MTHLSAISAMALMLLIAPAVWSEDRAHSGEHMNQDVSANESDGT